MVDRYFFFQEVYCVVRERYCLILASPVATVEKIHKSSTNDLSIYGSSSNRASEISRHGTVPPPGADRYPPVATLAGEQLLARSGFQPYRPDDR